MSRLRLTGRWRTMTCALATAALATAGLSGTAAHAAPAAPLAAAPAIGIQYNADGDAGQCGGATGQQWATSPDWTQPIRFDTDGRPGGCQLAFGVYDPDHTFAGASLSYDFRVSPGGDSGQCGNQGTYQMPIQPFQTFGPSVRVDTDNRSGYCNLTLAVSGRSDVGLDVQFYPDGDAGQCKNYLPAGQYRTAYAGNPVTVGIDADNRPGGCQFLLRLRHF
ncbi:hypothetical protein [Streptomyces sp. CBMA152]|uniref:hypothetical protein n=1 Tax=Streptomyces sp. CBMA152 TaxID=1896312 RepID=UPI001660B658|nr:hypothetical protein [Streptomyces sp. CBMA152]MBD0741268.1 hypothetical protein [Streptomyces sp. CBMA152]